MLKFASIFRKKDSVAKGIANSLFSAFWLEPLVGPVSEEDWLLSEVE